MTTIAGETLTGFDEAAYKQALEASGYPAKADPARMNKPMTVLLLVVLMLYVTMVYGPIAAFLVELFPTRIRYSSMSLPYHIGNGWFGGFLPFIAAALVVRPAISTTGCGIRSSWRSGPGSWASSSCAKPAA